MTQHDLAQLADDLDRAWASRDVDAILALHHAEGTFQAVGETPVFEGQEALRHVFSATLAARPDLRFERRNLILGEDTFVVEATMFAGEQANDGTPTLERRFVDVYTVRDAKVFSKASYLTPNQRD